MTPEMVIPSHTPAQLLPLWQRVRELVTGAISVVPELRELARQLKPTVEQAINLCTMHNVPPLTPQAVRSFHTFVRTSGVREDCVLWLEMYGAGY